MLKEMMIPNPQIHLLNVKLKTFCGVTTNTIQSVKKKKLKKNLFKQSLSRASIHFPAVCAHTNQFFPLNRGMPQLKIVYDLADVCSNHTKFKPDQSCAWGPALYPKT